jgi:hypothetical protein
MDFWNAYISDGEEEEEEEGGEDGAEGGREGGDSMYEGLDEAEGREKEVGEEGAVKGEGGEEEDLYGDLMEEVEESEGRKEEGEKVVARLLGGGEGGKEGGREGGKVLVPAREWRKEEKMEVEGLYAAVVDVAATLPILP